MFAIAHVGSRVRLPRRQNPSRSHSLAPVSHESNSRRKPVRTQRARYQSFHSVILRSLLFLSLRPKVADFGKHCRGRPSMVGDRDLRRAKQLLALSELFKANVRIRSCLSTWPAGWVCQGGIPGRFMVPVWQGSKFVFASSDWF